MTTLTRPSLSFAARLGGFILAGVLAGSVLRAAPYSLGNSDVRTLATSANGRTYTLSIGLPSSYASSPGRRYPVVYFLDAYWDFPLLGTTAGNLQVDGLIPEVILVGIGYAGTNPDVGALRQLDYTPGVDPGTDPTGTTSGQAESFLKVIEGQIIPLVEQDYRADSSYRVLCGSSYGGLFTMYASLERTTLFKAYVVSSPSLWWRGSFLAAREKERAAAGLGFPARVFLSAGEEDPGSIRTSTLAMYQQLRSHAHSGLAVSYWMVRGERHSSQKAEAYTRGLRFAFAPLAPRPSAVADPAVNAPSNLINVSTRGAVGTGDSVLIAGFIVSGPNPKRVLVRAVGPGLADFGVGNLLADPKLSVHNSSGAVVAENDNWGNAADGAALSSASAEAGVFALKSGSRDAAAVLMLEPGSYTVVVEGAGGTTGNALVEAYTLH